jgi:hypothetical protein
MRINSAWCSKNRTRNSITHPKNQHVDTDIAGPQRKEIQKYTPNTILSTVEVPT